MGRYFLICTSQRYLFRLLKTEIRRVINALFLLIWRLLLRDLLHDFGGRIKINFVQIWRLLVRSGTMDPNLFIKLNFLQIWGNKLLVICCQTVHSLMLTTTSLQLSRFGCLSVGLILRHFAYRWLSFGSFSTPSLIVLIHYRPVHFVAKSYQLLSIGGPLILRGQVAARN